MSFIMQDSRLLTIEKLNKCYNYSVANSIVIQ